MNTFTPPPGVPSILTIKATAAVLNFPNERVLRDWCRDGDIRAFRHNDGGRWWIPTAEVERLARLWLIKPDWLAAIEVDA